MVVDGGAAEGAHGLALGAADQNHQLVDAVVAHLPGIDDEAAGYVEVPEVLRDLGALHHGAADDRDLALVLAGQFHRDADTVDRRREAAKEELFAGTGEDLVEAWAHGTLAGRVA